MPVIKDILKEYKKTAKLNNKDRFEYWVIGDVVTIITNKPGYLIGKNGNLIHEYKEKLIPFGVNQIDLIEDRFVTKL